MCSCLTFCMNVGSLLVCMMCWRSTVTHFRQVVETLFSFFWYISKANRMCWDNWLVVSICNFNYIRVCKMYGLDFARRFCFLVAIWTVRTRCNAYCLFLYYLSHKWLVCLLGFCLTSYGHLLICNPFANVLIVAFSFVSHSAVTQFLCACHPICCGTMLHHLV